MSSVRESNESVEHLLALAASGETGTAMSVEEVLRLSRRYLDVDVAFVGRVEDGRRHLRAVSADDPALEGMVGHADPLDGSHCELVVTGAIARVIPDALAEPSMNALQATHDFRVRTFVGVPITLPDGERYGTLCGFAHSVKAGLDDSAESMLAFIAALLGAQLDAEHAGGKSRRQMRDRLEGLIEIGQPGMVFQPVIDLRDGRVRGYEALARFASTPPVTPDRWFAAAHGVGLGCTLEAAAIANALKRLDELPDGLRLSLNVSAANLGSEAVTMVLDGRDLSRVIIEITEYEKDVDVAALLPMLDALRGRGARIALDDVGSGYAGLERVVRVGPDRIKLDRALVGGIDENRHLQAMMAASVTYARHVDIEIVAEGIETLGELAVLRELGVALGQGYLLARPAPEFLPVTRLDWMTDARHAA